MDWRQFNGRVIERAGYPRLQRRRNISVLEFPSQGGAHLLQVLERPAASSTVQRVALNFGSTG
jgi:hypothetical protein